MDGGEQEVVLCVGSRRRACSTSRLLFTALNQRPIGDLMWGLGYLVLSLLDHCVEWSRRPSGKRHRQSPRGTSGRRSGSRRSQCNKVGGPGNRSNGPPKTLHREANLEKLLKAAAAASGLLLLRCQPLLGRLPLLCWPPAAGCRWGLPGLPPFAPSVSAASGAGPRHAVSFDSSVESSFRINDIKI